MKPNHNVPDRNIRILIHLDLEVVDRGVKTKTGCRPVAKSVSVGHDFSRLESALYLIVVLQVKRYSYTTSNESATSGQQLWSLERNCSGKCEDGCIVIGERIKIYACQACCETPLCNVSNGSGRRAPPPLLSAVCGLAAFLFLLLRTAADVGPAARLRPRQTARPAVGDASASPVPVPPRPGGCGAEPTAQAGPCSRSPFARDSRRRPSQQQQSSSPA